MTSAFSVVIPTHNRPALLEEALGSLAIQTIDSWEAIVVDDASETPVAIEALRKKFGHRLRAIRHEESRGGAAAKNTGIDAASAPVVAFLDDDDLYAPTYLEKALTALNTFPDLDVIFMSVSWFGKWSQSAWADPAYLSSMDRTLAQARGAKIADNFVAFGGDLFAAMLRSVPMAFQRPVVRASALKAIGGYREGCLLWDCDWAIRAALHGKTALCQERLYRQRTDGNGVSARRDIELAHHLDSIEMKERLFDELRKCGDQEHAEIVKEAVAEAWRSLAYYYSRKGRPLSALTAAQTSQLRQPRRHKLSYFGRTVLRSLVMKVRTQLSPR
jgi:glycosyltransferase involved in cell wall biosynthesis